MPQPSLAETHFLRAESLADAGQWLAAADAYRRALAAQPHFPAAQHNLAAALLTLGNVNEAAAACQTAIAQRADYPLAFNTLGATLVRQGKLADALAAFRHAVMLQPDYAKAHYNLGGVLDSLGRVAEAAASYRTALRLRPELEEARFDLAALGEGPAPPQMPTAYVARLFDDYAPTFDADLVARLGYAAPEQLRTAVDRLSISKPLNVLDLGCGTGLVGKALRPLAQRLTGVDLSPAMLTASAALKIYDSLAQAEIVEYLDSPGEAFDLIAAADVLIYFGELAPLFSAASKRLASNGLWAFSLELLDPAAGKDWLLRPTRRYAHCLEYVRAVATDFHLRERCVLLAPLRRQGNENVAGAIVIVETTVDSQSCRGGK